MDMVLVVVTGISMAMAIAMGGLVVSMLREDRRRSEARVAALLEMASASDARPRDGQRAYVPSADVTVPGADVAREHAAREHATRERAVHEPVAREHAAREAARQAAREYVRREYAPRAAIAPRPAPIARDAGDIELRRPETAIAGVAELFAEPQRSSAWGPRLAVAAALAAIVAGAGYLLLPRETPAAVAAAPAAMAQPPAAPVPLELLSLAHVQRQDSITVSGLVQNPASGTRAARVFASAFVFGEDGAFLASGRAPLDFITLAPGDESPFVVTVPVSARVARYRVGFRAADGSVIAHVDKRQAEAVAMK